ncbi:MAG: hypothetical protein ACR2IK_14145 [Chloroflexota bacterium]
MQSPDANGVRTNVNGVYVHVSCNVQLVAAAIIRGVQPLSIAADAEAVLGSADPLTGQFVPYQPTLDPYPRVLPVPTQTS